MKRIVILGSTGNVGRKALEVISSYKERFRVVGLSANRNFRLLLTQAYEFKVEKICIRDLSIAVKIKSETEKIKVFSGIKGLLKLLEQEVDLLILAISGTDAISPLLYAIEKNIDIALANKEAIIALGEIVEKKLKTSKSRIIPLDSEHNAICQILAGIKKREISSIILTCSGGPFLNFPKKNLEKVTPRMALFHPRWKMGKKITVDSATLMNKGFEIIEAHYIFRIPSEKIKVVIHPQALIHGMVELRDGTVIAQLAPTDMRMAISYSLGYPGRLDSGLRIDWGRLRRMTFKIPDERNYPGLRIARRCLELKMSYPAFLVKIDEIFVREFLKGKIKFPRILKLIQKAIELHHPREIKRLDSIKMVFKEAEKISKKLLEGIS